MKAMSTSIFVILVDHCRIEFREELPPLLSHWFQEEIPDTCRTGTPGEAQPNEDAGAMECMDPQFPMHMDKLPTFHFRGSQVSLAHMRQTHTADERETFSKMM